MRGVHQDCGKIQGFAEGESMVAPDRMGCWDFL